MAKTRVYELARDLNMKNKMLLDKLKEMEIDVGSHMSSLDDDTVTRVKAFILGKSEEDIVQETRVRPTVIRRRRKATPTPEEEAESEAAEEEAAAQAEEATVQPTPISEEASAPETGEPSPAPPEDGVSTPPSKLQRKKEERARIIKLAKPTEPPPAETAEPAEVPETEPEPEPKPKDKAETAEEAMAQETPAAEETVAETAPKPEPSAPSGTPAPVKKRAKKDTPARIIKLGTAPPVPPRKKPAAANRPRVVGRPPAGGPSAGAAAPREAQTGDKRARGKRRGEEPTRDRKFLKKKIAFRRKEVVEGADLYSRGGRSRRGRKGGRGKPMTGGQKTQITTAKAIKRRLKVDEAILLSELAKRMGIKAGDVIRQLMGMGIMATLNQGIDFDTAALVASEFGYEVERAGFEEESIIKPEADDPEKLAGRPPVVTIMGHVDHGKTSLLDVIRKSRVTEGEAGGITQHIGAYHVQTERGRIVFLDTPGHEAFTAMRSRGARVTDLVVLVVAADDGVMPQTIEAINHSKAAQVPIIVAVNKIDKANADPERVLRELSEQGLSPEEWGGDSIFVHVSAKNNEGIPELLEMISLQAEMMELKANPEKLAHGHVVEAKLDSGRGAVATVLVQEGTLHTGDAVVCGMHYGKVRALLDDHGTQTESAGPSIPVEIIGLSGVPNAGDEMVALADEKDAKQVSLHRLQKQRSKELARTNRLSLDNLFEQMQEGDVQDLNLIIKADVNGSIEALRDSLTKLSNEEVKISVIHSATGTITESDISLAAVSNAIIIGFNVRPNPKVQALANEENVDMRFYNVIYNVIKDTKDAIVGLMKSTFEEHLLGRAEVRELFHVPKVGTIAGCYVTDGKVERGQQVRLVRDGVVIHESRIGSLRRFKDDAKEVQSGYECGIGIEGYNDIKLNDVIECFFMEEIRPEMD